MAGGIVTELSSSPSTAITLFPWAGVTHTKGHRLLRLERSIWHLQSFAGRFRVPLPMCDSVESVMAAGTLVKNVCKT